MKSSDCLSLFYSLLIKDLVLEAKISRPPSTQLHLLAFFRGVSKLAVLYYLSNVNNTRDYKLNKSVNRQI